MTETPQTVHRNSVYTGTVLFSDASSSYTTASTTVTLAIAGGSGTPVCTLSGTSTCTENLVAGAGQINYSGTAQTTSFPGTSTITATAFDGDFLGNGTATATVTFTVIPIQPTAPSFTLQTQDHTAITTDVTQNGATYDPLLRHADLSVAITSAPSHGTATGGGPSSTTIVYTPSGNYIGSDTVGYQFSDGYSSASGTITINVIPVPVTAGSFSVAASTTKPIAVNLVPGHVTYDANDQLSNLHATISTQPAHGTATVSGTTITYTANDKTVSNDSIGYTFTDGYSTANGTITVALTPQQLGIQSKIAASTTFNQPATLNLAGYITLDPAESLSSVQASVTGLTHGTATISGTTITYTPNASYAGTDTGTVQVTDGYSTATGTLTIIVAPPVLTAKPATVKTNKGAPVAINLAGDIQDSAIPVSALKVTVATPPTHGSVSFAGEVGTYTPTAGYVGADSLVYAVTDGYTTANATITVSVNQTQVAVPPNIAGLTQAQAVAALQSAGFLVKVVNTQSATVPYGIVISSSPAPGTLANPGSTVQLNVSLQLAASTAAPISSVPGLTAAQQSVARAVENTCTSLHGAVAQGATLSSAQNDLLATCTAIVRGYAGGQNISGLQSTLNSVSGRQANSPQQMGVLFSEGQAANIAQRVGELRGGASGLSLSGLDLGLPGGVSEVMAPLLAMLKDVVGGGAGDESSLRGSKLGIFLNGNFTRGSQSTTEFEQGFDLQSNGLTAGVDYRFTDRLTLGLAGGYAKSTSEFDDAGGNLSAKSYTGTLYGTYTVNGFFINGLASGGHNSYNSVRDISFSTMGMPGGTLSCDGTTTCNTTAVGSTGARQVAFGLASGYDFHNDALIVGPDLAVNYARIDVNGFDETGPSGLNLAFGDQSGTSVRVKVGGHLAYNLSTKYCIVVPQAMARYVHEFNNDQQTDGARFVADTFSVAGFQIFTDQPDRNFFEYNVGVALQFPFNIAGFINFGSVAGLQNVTVHTFSVGLRVQPSFKSKD